MNDYNASKGCSFFKQGWIRKILYSAIGSDRHFLRAGYRPLERLRDPTHKLQPCIMNKGWSILRAHCICMAGMGSNCNHKTAAFFRVETAMRLGLITPACTEKKL